MSDTQPSASPAAGAPGQVPEATLLNFLSGLAAQALMQLGVLPNPLTGAREANVAYATYTVQLLRVLRDKTNGNRTPDEERYLNGVLADVERRLAALTAES